MKQIHRLLALGMILVLTVCCSNPNFNEDGLKSLLKEKTGIVIEDSLIITDFEWGAAIGDYYEEYDLKCSTRDHKSILNHAIKNGWEDLETGYSLVIPLIQISFSDTVFIFSVSKDKQEIRISIANE